MPFRLPTALCVLFDNMRVCYVMCDDKYKIYIEYARYVGICEMCACEIFVCQICIPEICIC